MQYTIFFIIRKLSHYIFNFLMYLHFKFSMKCKIKKVICLTKCVINLLFLSLMSIFKSFILVTQYGTDLLHLLKIIKLLIDIKLNLFTHIFELHKFKSNNIFNKLKGKLSKST